mmetsp:Transcript_21352/g.40570  ORF Transcript_21352/g.40570 Transcript_21352/m.40570 type:complete len:312 (-) Transcript_21352:45-980(-)
MSRISQIVFAVLAAGVAAFVSRWLAWHQTNEKLVSLLLMDENGSSSGQDMARSMKRQTELYSQLPPVVKRYLAKVLSSDSDDLDEIRKIKALHMHQTGTILLEGKWHPFRAIQTMSASHSNVGFLWDATVLLQVQSPPMGEFPFNGLDIPVSVRDAFVRGVGDLDARLLRVVTLAHVENSPDINEGELMRWVAEACLIPTALLPSDVLSWEAVAAEPQQARIHFTDIHSNTKADLLISFDHDDLLRSVEGMRAKSVGNNKFEHAKWKGRMLEYQTHDGMLLPLKMEAGWVSDDKLDIYWKGEAVDFNFTYY